MCSVTTFQIGIIFMASGMVLIISGYLNLKVIRTIDNQKVLKERNKIAEKLIKKRIIKTSTPQRSGLFFV